jgi:hypothetical protein
VQPKRYNKYGFGKSLYVAIIALSLWVLTGHSCPEKARFVPIPRLDCTYLRTGFYLFNALQKLRRVAVELKGLFTLQCKTLVTMLTGLSKFSRAFSHKTVADFISLVFFGTSWAQSSGQPILVRSPNIFTNPVTMYPGQENSILLQSQLRDGTKFVPNTKY